jgi:uncharacterized membrane protein YfhO
MSTKVKKAKFSFKKDKADKAEISEKDKNYNEKTKLYLIFSFLLPMLLMIIGFANKKVYPFGDQQILVTDLWHQYYPFFRLLHEKLQTGGSLLYTWKSGMGTNFISLMSYYAASPLNFLSIFVSEKYLREALAAIVILKISCAGLFFAIFLKKTFGKNDLSLCIFSVLFALCSYIMGYYWNVIWIDTVALLPLVVLGVEQLVKEGKYRLYVIALALSLISNYYIGLFICIFTVFAFFISSLFFRISFKKFWVRVGQIAIFTIISAGIAAFILIPTFDALQLTHSVNNTFPKNITWYENFRDIIGNMMAFHEPTSVDGLPNLYCGTLCMVLLGVYLRSPKIMIREKIVSIAMLVFIVVSCNMNILNYLWHGMHFTNQIPYRFAFLFSFMLVTMAYRAYTVIADGGLKLLDCILILAVGIAFFSISYGTQEDNKVILYTLIVFLLYTIFIFLHERKILKLEYMRVLIGLVVLVEMSFNVKYGIESVRTTTRTGYPSNSDEVSAELDKIYEKEEDNTDLYRIELSSWYTLNDPALYSYNGVSQFSSMANESMSKWCDGLGLLGSAGGNRYFYASTSPLTNIFTNVKYVMAKDGYNADTFSMQQVSSTDSVATFENIYDVALGFMTEDGILDFDPESYSNPFEAQNEWLKESTDITEDLFEPIQVKDVGHKGLTVTKSDYGKYSYSEESGTTEEEYFLKYNYLVPDNQMIYAYTDISAGKSNCLTLEEGVQLHSYNIKKQPYIFPVGQFEEGTTVTLKMPIETDDCNGNATVYLYTINEDVLKQAYEYYSQSKLNVTSYKDTKVNATINAQSDGLLYTSIPYESGWTVKVDGEEVETYAAGKAMLSIYLTAGEHTIEYSYIPAGFVMGMVISVTSILILVALYIIERKRRKDKMIVVKYPALFDTTNVHMLTFSKNKSVDETDSDTDTEKNTDESEENSDKSENNDNSQEESKTDKE